MPISVASSAKRYIPDWCTMKLLASSWGSNDRCKKESGAWTRYEGIFWKQLWQNH